MWRKWTLSFAFAVATGLAGAEAAQVQSYFGFSSGLGWTGGYPYYGGYTRHLGGSYYGPWGYSRPSIYANYYAGPGKGYHGPGHHHTAYFTHPYEIPGETTSYYRGPAVDSSNRAQLHIEVPTADARIWLEGTPTTPTGLDRRFVSPPLEPGQPYVYTVRATWMEGGRERSLEKSVNVRAGDQARVSFR